MMKHKILFVCHGNICRSPMAEFVMKHLVEEHGLQDQFEIASAATSTEEIGNPVYPSWTTPLVPEWWPTHGTPAILRPLGGMCWKVARV